jgi:hypothetical protein
LFVFDAMSSGSAQSLPAQRFDPATVESPPSGETGVTHPATAQAIDEATAAKQRELSRVGFIANLHARARCFGI